MKPTKPIKSPTVQTDIAIHFANQLQILLNDVFGTCEHAGIANGDATLMLMTGMLVEVSKGALMIQLGRADFIRFAAHVHDEIERQMPLDS